MAWKEIHNGEPNSYNITNSGICKRDERQAKVTSFFVGNNECRTDLQKTYHFSGYNCSLQEENGYQNPSCMENCLLIRKEYL